MTEASVTINGHALTEAQSMTLRVALTSHLVQMAFEGALGEDTTGEALRKLYLDRSAEVINLIERPSPAPEKHTQGDDHG